MDAVDFRILRAMGPVSYQPAVGPDALRTGRLARALGLAPETVRERVARMEAEGVIRGYQVYPNFRHLGLESAAYFFRMTDETRRARTEKDLAAMDGLLSVTWFLGRDMCVDLVYKGPGDLARKLKLMGSMTGDEEPAAFFARQPPAVARPLTNLDWRILRALRGRARHPLPAIAEELGVGYRTVKRHYDRMAREGSFVSVPLVDPASAGGLIPVAFLVFLHSPGDAAALAGVRKLFEDSMMFGDVPGHPRLGNFDLLAFVPSTARAEELRRAAGALPGVARVEALPLAGGSDHADWLDEAIEERIRATGG